MLDTVLHAILDFVGAHSALLTVLILIALGVGMVLCLTVQKRRFTVREIAVMGMLAALNVVLNLALIPLWGASGAAAASLITQASTTILLPALIRPLRPNAKLMLDAVLLLSLIHI